MDGGGGCVDPCNVISIPATKLHRFDATVIVTLHSAERGHLIKEIISCTLDGGGQVVIALFLHVT